MIIPGKTFLLGEYVALSGGPSLVACTRPGYVFDERLDVDFLSTLHPQSPAANLLKRVQGKTVSGKLKIDSLKGFGSSTAEYLYAYQSLFNAVVSLSDIAKLLEAYKFDTSLGKELNIKPSGADLVAQTREKIVFWNPKKNFLQTIDWKFQNLNGFLIKMNDKLNTHEHLSSIDHNKVKEISESSELIRYVETAYEGLLNADEDLFIDSIKGFSRVMQENKFVSETTLDFLHDVLWFNGVRAAKGCGAMGNDVVFVVVDKSSSDTFKKWLIQNEITFFDFEKDLFRI